ncbi:histone-like nucleoid-structuring protein Lsr2 [Catellatospora sp. NPDC049111]|uniref:Lsr2 dimerization domain-containing protein n=1 Tax=Catellatospora sp. NPDC049111 TaxID=3155271 RepID=UPI0033ECF10A
MVSHIREVVVDDLDGHSPAQPVAFAYQGRRYRIDLNAANLAAMRRALQPFIDSARPDTTLTPQRRVPRTR